MPSPTTRGLRILDILVLVLATVVGMAGCRDYFATFNTSAVGIWPSRVPWAMRSLWIWAMWTIPALSLLVFSWTVAILLLRLQEPRPVRRCLWSQPGFLACVAVLFALAWKFLGIGLVITAGLLQSEFPREPYLLDSISLREMLYLQLAPRANVGGAIAFAWFLVWASGRLRPEPTWIDRAGRAIGAVWITFTLLGGGVHF
jgi:hypothetical protein